MYRHSGKHGGYPLIRLQGALILPQHICPCGRLSCLRELRVGQRRGCGRQRVCPALEALALCKNIMACLSLPVAAPQLPVPSKVALARPNTHCEALRSRARKVA